MKPTNSVKIRIENPQLPRRKESTSLHFYYKQMNKQILQEA